jgi:hypothetical protein
MSKKVKVRVTSDGAKGFFDRAREHARKLDRGEALAPEITVLFENASDMMRFFPRSVSDFCRLREKRRFLCLISLLT